VALDGDVLCFVEIKARRSDRYGSPLEAVTPGKQNKVARAAAAYLQREPHDGPCRFDVLGMSVVDGDWRFTLVRDAFTRA
jgi:putative endonuclease